jgi:hypothetical protein
MNWGRDWGRGRTFVVGLALVVLALGGCSSEDAEGASTTTEAAEADASGSFELLSYNVAGLPQEISKANPKDNIPKISPLLEPYDVVLTQEDFDWWKPDGLASKADFVNYHDRLRAEVTHEFQTSQHPGPEAVGIDIAEDRPLMELGDGLGVLSRLPIDEDATRVPWTDCEGGFDSGASDCLAMKGFLVTTLTLADGVEVDLYNLHGEAGGGEADQALQADDYEQLAAYIVENSEGRAVILGGDTNLHTDLEHEDAADGADIEIWETFLEATGLTDACTATDCDRPGAIDKVAFRSGDGVDLEVSSHAFVEDDFLDEAGEDLSDHPPLAVGFAWQSA